MLLLTESELKSTLTMDNKSVDRLSLSNIMQVGNLLTVLEMVKWDQICFTHQIFLVVRSNSILTLVVPGVAAMLHFTLFQHQEEILTGIQLEAIEMIIIVMPTKLEAFGVQKWISWRPISTIGAWHLIHVITLLLKVNIHSVTKVVAVKDSIKLTQIHMDLETISE